jgi:hypothetical protein
MDTQTWCVCIYIHIYRCIICVHVCVCVCVCVCVEAVKDDVYMDVDGYPYSRSLLPL